MGNLQAVFDGFAPSAPTLRPVVCAHLSLVPVTTCQCAQLKPTYYAYEGKKTSHRECIYGIKSGTTGRTGNSRWAINLSGRKQVGATGRNWAQGLEATQ